MKKLIIACALCVMCCVASAANGGETAKTVAKCAVYPESVLSHKYVNGGKHVDVEFALIGGSTVRVTLKAKDYLRFVSREAAYDLALLADKSVVMIPTVARQPR